MGCVLELWSFYTVQAVQIKNQTCLGHLSTQAHHEFLHMYKNKTTVRKVPELIYLECELNELRYKTHQALVSHNGKKGQQELVAGLAGEEEADRCNE